MTTTAIASPEPSPRYRPGDPVRLRRGLRAGLELVVAEVLPGPEEPGEAPTLVRVREARGPADGPATWVMPSLIEPAGPPPPIRPGDLVRWHGCAIPLRVLAFDPGRPGKALVGPKGRLAGGMSFQGWLPLAELERAS